MLERVKFNCGHTYLWVLAGKNGNCAYCDGEYPDGTKCHGGKSPVASNTDFNMTQPTDSQVKHTLV